MSTLDVLHSLLWQLFFSSLIIYNYDLVLPYFYYEFLHSCPVISGYVLKNMYLGSWWFWLGFPKNSLFWPNCCIRGRTDKKINRKDEHEINDKYHDHDHGSQIRHCLCDERIVLGPRSTYKSGKRNCHDICTVYGIRYDAMHRHQGRVNSNSNRPQIGSKSAPQCLSHLTSYPSPFPVPDI